MTARTLYAALALGSALLASSAVQAGIVLGGREYPDEARVELQEYCRGLQAQANTSLTAEYPDVLDSPDPASNVRLSDVPFTLRDCRIAGLV